MIPAAGTLRAITLDLDDTLWPVLPTLVAAEARLEAWLAEHAPQTARRCARPVLRDMRLALLEAHPERAHDMNWLRHEGLRRAIVGCGEDPALADAAFEVFLAARQQVTLYPDVRPVLARWASRWRLVAVTNGNADVSRVGLADLFSACISAHEIGVAKPDARMFEAACEAGGATPQTTLHVGDDIELDVGGARRAGLHAAWLRRADLHNASTRRLIEAGTETAWDSLSAIDEALGA
ncbi:MAG: HAD family hydrolase [Lautropia sp.]